MLEEDFDLYSKSLTDGPSDSGRLDLGLDDAEKPIVLILHAMRSDSADLPGQGLVHRFLEAGCRVIVAERRGHTSSSSDQNASTLRDATFYIGGHDQNLEQSIDFCHRLFRFFKKKMPKMFLLGTSMGAAVLVTGHGKWSLRRRRLDLLGKLSVIVAKGQLTAKCNGGCGDLLESLLSGPESKGTPKGQQESEAKVDDPVSPSQEIIEALVQEELSN